MPTSPFETIQGRRLVKPAEVFKLLGYADRAAGWAAVRAAGIPFIRINSRRALFDERAVVAWLDSRTVGGVDRPAA